MCVCERGGGGVRRRVLTQKPVLIMKNSIEPPIMADTTAIFKYQSRNFIVLLSLCSLSLPPSPIETQNSHRLFEVLGFRGFRFVRSYLTRPKPEPDPTIRLNWGRSYTRSLAVGTQHPQPIRLSISQSKTAHYYRI